jgi:uncharacterized membrane protein YdjX (TVP38/TMEM64 family)
MAEGLLAGGEDTRTERKRARPAVWRFAPLAVVALGLVAGYAMGWHHYLSLDYLAESRDALRAKVDAHYGLALGGFFLFYVIAVAFSFPAASVLTIFAGFLFGVLVGGSLVVLAATIGASILFLAARTAFGGALKRRLGTRLARMAQGFEDDAFGYLLILRLAPVFPFFVVNIAPAFFDVRLRTFVAATFLGILPGTFAYAYLGKGVDSVIAAAERGEGGLSAADLVTPEITIALAALALVAALATIVKRRARS